jgi:hypothetical protein
MPTALSTILPLGVSIAIPGIVVLILIVLLLLWIF